MPQSLNLRYVGFVRGVWFLKSLTVCVSRCESEACGNLCSGLPISKLLWLCPIVGVQVFQHLCSWCEVSEYLRVCVTRFESEVFVSLCSGMRSLKF